MAGSFRSARGAAVLGFAVALVFPGAAAEASPQAAPAPGVAASAQTAPAPAVSFDHEHLAWSRFLGRFVREGAVDYPAIRREGKADLAAYLRALESVGGEYGGWSRERKLAYWINAYNAYVVSVVVDAPGVRSVLDLDGGQGAVFRREFIRARATAAHPLSLDEVEKAILRKRFAEPRVHFALVCAARGCPALRGTAYTAADLESQLDSATRGFLADPAHLHYDAPTGTLHLSPLFQWYADEFAAAAGSVPAWVARYLDGPTATAVARPGTEIVYLDYDWALNGPR